MKLTGTYKIKSDKNSVWKALNDPEILKKSIPGCEEFKKNSDTNFTATATNKIGPFPKSSLFTTRAPRSGLTFCMPASAMSVFMPAALQTSRATATFWGCSK